MIVSTSCCKYDVGMRGARHRRAFSLVEGLVATLILVILLAIAVPGLGHARRAASESRCVVSIRSAGSLVHAYASESRELVPHGAYVPDSLLADEPMVRVIYQESGVEVPYFRVASLWAEILADWQGAALMSATCPSADPEMRVIPRPTGSSSSGGRSTYRVSAALLAAPPLWREEAFARETDFVPQPLSAALFPSDKGFLYEQRVLHIDRDSKSPLDLVTGASPVVFVDGHASLASFRAIPAIHSPFDDTSPMPYSHTPGGVLGRDVTNE
jgi:type II secretory pathway pseudopilin PulG